MSSSRLTRLIHWNKAILKDIELQPHDEYRLRVWFEDGAEGVIDVAQMVPFSGIFAPLRNRSELTSVQVNHELGTICWPSGADLDPGVVYSMITGEALPTYDESVEAKAQ